MALKTTHLGLYLGPCRPLEPAPPHISHTAPIHPNQPPDGGLGSERVGPNSNPQFPAPSRRQWELLHSVGCHFVKTATAVLLNTNLSPKNGPGNPEFSLRDGQVLIPSIYNGMIMMMFVKLC